MYGFSCEVLHTDGDLPTQEALEEDGKVSDPRWVRTNFMHQTKVCASVVEGLVVGVQHMTNIPHPALCRS